MVGCWLFGELVAWLVAWILGWFVGWLDEWLVVYVQLAPNYYRSMVSGANSFST